MDGHKAKLKDAYVNIRTDNSSSKKNHKSRLQRKKTTLH